MLRNPVDFLHTTRRQLSQSGGLGARQGAGHEIFHSEYAARSERASEQVGVD